MDNVLKVETLSMLNALQNHKIGEIIYVEETEKYMIYSEEGWVDLTMNKEAVDNAGLHMSEYEVCKMALSSMSVLEADEELDAIVKMIDKWADGDCFLLYGQEMHIFDLFEAASNSEYETVGEAVIKLLINNFGGILRADISENNEAVEIWIKYHDETPTFLMLMPWEVIYYGK